MLGLRGLAFFTANPNLFEEMIEANFVVGGGGGAAIGGVGQRAGERMAGTVLRGVEMEMAVGEFDAAVGLAGDVGVVRDHEDGVAGIVEFAEKLEDDFLVGFVEVTGGLVGEDDSRLIDEGTGDGYALLLTAGKICGEMREAIGEPDALEGGFGLLFVSDAVEVLREHDIFEGGEIRDEVELLEDEANFFGAEAD